MEFSSTSYFRNTILIFFTVLLAGALDAQVYVNHAATGANDGSSWANAYTELQPALIDGFQDVFIAEGTYKPTEAPDGSSTNPRDKAFFVASPITIKGGYDPSTGLQNGSATILSGDLAASGNITDNAYHVLIIKDFFGSSPTFDNITIQDGNANGTGNITFVGESFSRGTGGGILNSIGSSETLSNCLFTSNYATTGAGMYNIASPTLTNCTFLFNDATNDGGGIYNNTNSNPVLTACVFKQNSGTSGGAIYNSTNSTPTVSNCTFESNLAGEFGGGMYNLNATVSLISSHFYNNEAANTGGGVYNNSSSTTLTNCAFTQNFAEINTGGIHNISSSTATLTNCTFARNSAIQAGGAIFNQLSSSSIIKNCILWENDADETQFGSEIGNFENGTATVSYSIVEGGWTGCSNCPGGLGDVDPLFISASDANGIDNIFSTADDGINLMIESQAINAGTTSGAPSVDIVGVGRMGIPDIGAYEPETCNGNLVFVNFSAMGNNTGISWENAFIDFQDGLDQAQNCGADSILVAEGTYKPSSSPDENSTNARDKSFHFNNDVVIKGGYDASTGTLTGGATIFSGDIGVANDASDNAYHVMVNTGLTTATILENLTFRDGNSDGSSSNDMAFGGTTFDRQYGGGIYNKSSDPIYSNCVFINNTATVNGGGLYLTSSDATVNDCVFTSNSANNGGGLANAWSSSSTISRSIFDSNMALSTGGGVANIISSQATVTNCAFIDNSANDGGGITNSGTSIDIINCTLTTNSASNSAGSIFSSSTTNLTNSICWGNGGEIVGTSLTVSNSIIEGGFTGCIDCPNTNGDINPEFIDAADPEGPDNILGTIDDNISLLVSSPAINAGNPNGAPSEDITKTPRIEIVDIGAYEARCQNQVVYVNVNAIGNENGLSWINAYTDLQDALDLVMICGVDSILIAEGTYYPTSSPDGETSNLRKKTFHIYSDVIISGGYDPNTGIVTANPSILSGDIGNANVMSDNAYHVMVTEGLSESSVFNNLTFRDGNASFNTTDFREGGGMYNKNSSPTLTNCNFIANSGIIGGGLHNFVSSPALTNCTFSDNIAQGNANLSRGGGMYNSLASPTLTNCTFTDNSALAGAGMYNNASSLVMTNCTFSFNISSSSAQLGGGGGMSNAGGSLQLDSCTFISNSARYGGGISNSQCSGQLTNCTFTNNIAQGSFNGGGGMKNKESSPVLTNCTFTSNTSISSGAGISNEDSSPQLFNCVFTENVTNGTASPTGGGMHSQGQSSPELSSCIFRENSSVFGGGLSITFGATATLVNTVFESNTSTSSGGGIYHNSVDILNVNNCTFLNNTAPNGNSVFSILGFAAITNSILWGNGSEIDGNLSVTYSIIEGGYGSSGCVGCPNTNGDIDPLFINEADPDGPDNILGTVDDGISLLTCSPALNAGNPDGAPSDDITGATRIGIIDIGAYEGLYQNQINLVYVDINAIGTGSGLNWTDAFTDLQFALDLTLICGFDSILVAEGTYYPTSSPDESLTDLSDRAFHINSDVVVIGGYNPITGTQTGGATILSGDIGVVNDVFDNAYHVLINTGLTTASVFEGLTFTDGRAYGSGENDMTYGGATFDRRFGGGIYNKSSDPLYSNCIFTNNVAIENGGGLYITDSDATITDCLFTSNEGEKGAGLCNSFNSSSIISRSIFDSNLAFLNGGGMANIETSQSTITNCVFINNLASSGAGIANSGTSIDIINCTLNANSASNSAGSILASSNTIITNSISWDNGSEISGISTVSNSIVEGGYAGCIDCPNTNGDIYPLFNDEADLDGPDDIMGTIDDGLSLRTCSPAINAGNPNGAPSDDIAGATRIGIIDIGAYEGITQNQGDLVYVDINAIGTGSGLNWTDAFTDLQFALDLTIICGVDSILVAEGTYYPTSSPDESLTDPRDRAFHINSDVVVIGGYNPFIGTQTGGATILSGDIGVVNDASDNAYHVLINTGLTNASVFEGLTFTDGRAYGSGENDMTYGGTTFDRRFGGGIYNKFSDPQYSKCIFTNNVAIENGGGLYLADSDATITDCLFTLNEGEKGAGLCNSYNSTSIISRSIFDLNIAFLYGGGIANIDASQSTITNCAFINNIANSGAGIANSGTSIDIINCTLNANSASNSAGSILASSNTVITNSISWDNGSEISGISTVLNSIVEGGYAGCVDCPNTNGNLDPQFVNESDPDGLDDIFGTADDGINLMVSSQVINAGSAIGAPLMDITGAVRLGIPDIGAYEAETCLNNTVFVSAIAVGNNSGSSWTDAYTDLQDALDQAMFCEVDSILVAEGIYYPSSSPDESTIDSRDRAFHISTDIVLEGGYNPLTGINDGNTTILSGDLVTAGITSNDSAYHVMVHTGLTSATVFEGLTFSDGNANGIGEMPYEGATFDRRYGGGIYNKFSDPIYVNCVFMNNTATEKGGGLYLTFSNATLNDCLFTSNTAYIGGGVSFVGEQFDLSEGTLTNCTFIDNSAFNGGGMHNIASKPTLTNCTFTSNSAINRGAGMSNLISSAVLTNCTFTSNTAYIGGGIYNSLSNPKLTNCTFMSNTAAYGGGMYITNNSFLTLTNCNFTSNSADYLGGGMRNTGVNVIELTTCTFTSNTAPNGGGMANSNYTEVSLTDCSFYVPISNQAILNESATNTTIIGTVTIQKE